MAGWTTWFQCTSVSFRHSLMGNIYNLWVNFFVSFKISNNQDAKGPIGIIRRVKGEKGADVSYGVMIVIVILFLCSNMQPGKVVERSQCIITPTN